MQIYRVDHHGAAQASGVVIVIDVIRAFTVARCWNTGRGESYQCCSPAHLRSDYLEALFLKPEDASNVLAKGIAHLQAIERFKWFEPDHTDWPSADIEAILAADQFHFAMVGTHKQWDNIRYVDIYKVDVPTTNL